MTYEEMSDIYNGIKTDFVSILESEIHIADIDSFSFYFITSKGLMKANKSAYSLAASIADKIANVARPYISGKRYSLTCFPSLKAAIAFLEKHQEMKGLFYLSEKFLSAPEIKGLSSKDNIFKSPKWWIINTRRGTKKTINKKTFSNCPVFMYRRMYEQL